MILSGHAYIGGRFIDREILVEEGKIVRIGTKLTGRKIRVSGMIVPGAIDIHTHLREPGHEQKEDFFTGTRAAARGGVTCVLDMPNTEPPTKYLEDVEAKKARASAKAVVDWGVYALLSSPTLAGSVAPHVVGFKVFLAASTGGLKIEKEELEHTLDSPHLAGKLVAVHAEDPSKFRQRPLTGLAAWDEARPEEAETAAVEYVCNLARKLAAKPPAPKLHLCHLTTPRSLELARAAAVSHEVAPHHLLLSTFMPEARVLGPRVKVNPPLRGEMTRRKMREELRAGRIPILATDHAPHLPEQKSTFEKGESGMPELEWALPILVAQVKRGEFPIQRVLDAFTSAPAALLGIKKGVIAEGMDADFAVFDSSDAKKIGKTPPVTKCGWSPYIAFEAVFPKAVFLRGELIVDDHEVVGDRGKGRDIVRPPQVTPAKEA